MAVVRIRGKWLLTLAETGSLLASGNAPPLDVAELHVTSADRTRLSGTFSIGADRVQVTGRVKPGNPGIITLAETNSSGAVEDGLDAILYIPPFWPTVDYDYDLLVGVLKISSGSGLKKKGLHDLPLSVAGGKELPKPGITLQP